MRREGMKKNKFNFRDENLKRRFSVNIRSLNINYTHEKRINKNAHRDRSDYKMNIMNTVSRTLIVIALFMKRAQ